MDYGENAMEQQETAVKPKKTFARKKLNSNSN
jgi:hypothetical protein